MEKVQCLKSWALAMHICMTLLLIAPFDLPKEKDEVWEASSDEDHLPRFCSAKACDPTRMQNSPKTRAAVVDAGLLGDFSSSVEVFRVDAPLLIPICVIKEADGVLCISCSIGCSQCADVEDW